MTNPKGGRKGAGKKAAARKPAVQNRTPKKEVLPVWADAFLAAFSETGNVRAACTSARIGRQTFYDLRDRSDEFRTRLKDAKDDACDALELESRRRAKDGVTKTIFYKGVPIGTEHEYSDTLMIFLLKAHRPEIYRETINQNHGGTIETRLILPKADADSN